MLEYLLKSLNCSTLSECVCIYLQHNKIRESPGECKATTTTTTTKQKNPK